MEWRHILVLFSVILCAIGSIAYIRDTLRGTTKPNRMSWALWAFAPLAGAFIAALNGADLWAVLRAFLAGFFPLIIFLCSFLNPLSYWRLGWFDYACAITSLFSFYIWLGMDSPTGAILFLVLADLLASIPIIVKAWTHPETETRITYLMGIPIFLLNVPAIPEWNVENSAFQVYLFALSLTLTALTYRRAWSNSGSGGRSNGVAGDR
jgi:hypothetical protein